MRLGNPRWPQLLRFGLFLWLFSLSPGGQAAWPTEVDGKPLPSLAPMLEKVLPAIVNVSVTNITQQPAGLFQDPFFRQFFNLPETGQPQTEASAGSGVIVNAEDGLIVTNHHVVEGAQSVSVTLYNGQELEAEILGSDDATDVALLQVDSEFMRALPLGNSDELQIGDFVVAVGNPFGLGHSVTSGIVSALGRTGLGIEHYEDFIQTDASINPGNSGGALINLRGELIGINTAIIAPGGGNIGIGFSIPINRVRQVASQLVEHGNVKRGILGVVTEDLPHAYTASGSAPTLKGALITEVIPRSPAARAHLQPGDIIVQIGTEEIDTASDLRNTLGLVRVGDSRLIRFWRGTDLEEVRVIIEDPQILVAENERIYDRLSGASFMNITISTRRGPRGAVLVTSVDRGSSAAQLGVRPDDIIIGANKTRVESLEELRAQIDQAEAPFVLSIERDGKMIALKVL